MPDSKNLQEANGREAYRRSLEMNCAGTPTHGRKCKPMSQAKRDELARLYDMSMEKHTPSP